MSSALDYSLVKEADSGIGIRIPLKRQAFLLHGTTWESKHWPIERWINLASLLGSEGLEVLISWGNVRERKDAEAIASETASVVLPRMSLKQLASKLGESMVTVGVDTGLTHLSAALGASTIGLYGPTSIDSQVVVVQEQKPLVPGTEWRESLSNPFGLGFKTS
ncbi:MAG: hypothetical protein Ct9H90mP27_4710 [Gammaproteobacteria bacterium]|nr:MAG: hypothetical protein Ct9H90mP27_4710 [Gammaproteobacteria bacterium]